METATAPDPPTESAPLSKKPGRGGCRSKALAGCGVIVIFALGTFFGVVMAVLLLTWIVPRAEGWRSAESQEFLTKYTADRLQLTPEQREVIDPMVIEMLQRRFELRKQYLLETRELLTVDTFPRIREHLTPEQIERANDMLKKWDQDNQLKLEGDPTEMDRKKSDGND